jgi:hypothetical protein
MKKSLIKYNLLALFILFIGCSESKLPNRFIGYYSGSYGSFTINEDGTFSNIDENGSSVEGVWKIIDSEGSSDDDWMFTLKFSVTEGSESDKEVFEYLTFKINVANSNNKPVLTLTAAGYDNYYYMQ